MKVFIKSAGHFCKRIYEDAQYVDDVLKKSPNLSKHYLHIRHEDFALDPIGITNKIYKFIGKSPGKELIDWVENSTLKTCKGSQNSQSTCRDSKKVISA